MEFITKAKHIISIYDGIYPLGYNDTFRDILINSENAHITIDTLKEDAVHFWIKPDHNDRNFSSDNLTLLAWIISSSPSESTAYLINKNFSTQKLFPYFYKDNHELLNQWDGKTIIALIFISKIIFIDVNNFKNVDLFIPKRDTEEECFRTIKHNSKIIISTERLKNIMLNKKETTMNIPMTNDFEFGPATESVRISPTGIAVTNDNEHWFTYDPKTAKTVDVTGFTFDFPGMLYKMPVAVKDLREGDVVLHKGKPMFITGVDSNGIDAIDILESEAKVILPVTNMFNFSYVTKIVSFINLGGSPSPDQPFGNIMPIMAAQALFNDGGENGFPGGIEKLFMYNAMMGNGSSPFGNLFNFNNNNE